MATALSELLGEHHADAFLRHHWPEKPGCFHGTLERLPAVLRAASLMDLSALAGLYRGRVAVSAGNEAQYVVSGVPVDAAVLDLGLTVRLECLEDEILTDARGWLRELEHELGLPEGVSSIMLFANARGAGLSLHCDGYEHFVVQLVGRKRYRVRPHPTSRFPSISHTATMSPQLRHYVQCPDGLPSWRQAPPDSEDLVLEPGSVLFMPRGLYHETESSHDGLAITLVIRVVSPTFTEILINYLELYLLQEEAWRTPAIGGWSSDPETRERARQQLGRLVARLGAELPELDIGRMFTSRQPVSRLVTEMDHTVRLQRNPALALDVSRVDDAFVELRVVSASGDLRYSGRFQSALEPVLCWLQERGPAFDLAALASAFGSWDERSLLALLAFLVKKQALVIVPIESSRRAGA